MHRVGTLTGAALGALTLLLTGCGESKPESPESPPEPSATAEVSSLPEDPFPEPTGPFAVGVREEHWTDASREDPFTSDPDDLRRVPVRFWYPARTSPDGSPLPGRPAAYLLDPEEFTGVDAILQASHVKTHAVLDAPVAETEGPHPVLLYHHGGGWPRFVGTALGEELASHGYVVVAVGHDGFNQATRRPDGSSVVADALPFPEESGDLEADALASWDHLDRHYFPQWVADARFVLDQLGQLATDDGWALAGALDLDRIGSYGWSFGGATSIELAVVDPRIVAAANLDGQLFGTASSRGSSRPILLVGAGGIDVPTSDDPEETARLAEVYAELIGLVEAAEQELIERSTAAWYRFDLTGATHGTFSDFLHFSPPGPDGIDPERGHEILSELLRAFFGEHLRGEPASWLDDASATFPELIPQPLD